MTLSTPASRALEHDVTVNGTANIGSDREIPVLGLEEPSIRPAGSRSISERRPELVEAHLRRHCPHFTRRRQLLRRRPSVWGKECAR